MELLQQNPWLVPLVGIVALVAVGATLLLVAAVMVASKTAQAEEKTVHDVALEVLAGMWGNGEDRKQRLMGAGYDPEEVQAAVNELLERRDK